MTTFLRNLINDETGATAIEYGLIAALIAIALVTALTQLGGALNDTFGNVESELEGAQSG
jgi:pilus assembly protein Flp/PilA